LAVIYVHVALFRPLEVQGFWKGDLRERNHIGDLGVDRSIILIWISGSGMGRQGVN